MKIYQQQKEEEDVQQEAKITYEINNVEIKTPTLEFRRWLVLAAFCTLTFSNQTSFVVLSPIMKQAQQYYICQNKISDVSIQCSDLDIEWFMNVFYIIYVLFSIPACFMLKWRLDISIWLSSFLNALGSWLRYFSGQNYICALISVTIISIAQIWSLGAPGIIAETWFSSEERIMATSIAIFSNIMGSSFGYLMSATVVGNDPSKINQVMAYNNIWMTIPFILCVLFFKSAPTSKPNYSSQASRISMTQSLKEIYLNPKILLNLIILSAFQGISWTFCSVISNLFEPFGFDSLTIGYIGLVMNTSGTFGGLVSSIFMEKQIQQGKTPNYDFFIKLFSSISIIFVIILAIIIQLTFLILQTAKGFIHTMIYIISACVGFGFFSFAPFAAQSFVESTFPANEIISFVAFFQVSNLLGLIGNLLSNSGMWFIVMLLAPFYFYMIFCYKTVHKRYDCETEMQYQNLQQHQNFIQDQHSQDPNNKFKQSK